MGEPSNEKRVDRKALGLAAAALAALCVLVCGHILFARGRLVLSDRGADLAMQFVHWRAFGFGELRAGNLALWNPYVFGGMPYLAGFQSALLYPPNVLYLFFSLPHAINAGIVLHLLLCGAFMYLWAVSRGLHPLAAFMAGVALVFGGAHYLHVYAGHLPNLCTMAWVPLLFLALDRLFDARRWAWWWVAVFAVTMQVLAGHPQYVFYTALAAGLYSALRLYWAECRAALLARLLSIYPAAAALSAVQLLTGLAAAGQTVRSGAVPFEFASMFSFPPENLLTLLAPGFFGDMHGLSYWGRCYLWEMSLFAGGCGLVLGVLGLVHGERRGRWFCGAMVLALFLLALGAHTPLFRLLYAMLPGFNKFRGSSKFVYYAAVFGALLDAVGLDSLLRGRAGGRRTGWIVFAVGVGVAAVAGAVRLSAGSAEPASLWAGLMRAVHGTGESYFPAHMLADAAFVRRAGLYAARGLFYAAGALCVVGGLLFFARTRRWLVYALAAVWLVELLAFASRNTRGFAIDAAVPAELSELASAAPRDARTLNLANANAGMSVGLGDVWGYDPGVLRRYAELMTATQGGDPARAGQYLTFERFHPLYRMLRCRFLLVPEESGLRARELEPGMARFALVGGYRVERDRARRLAALTAQEFDPRAVVLLETEPDPVPAPGPGSEPVRVLSSSTDHVELELELAAPKILLMTDTYAPGWRARAMPGSAQARYTLLPANHALRAVPLQAGLHRLRIEYLPRAFVVGGYVSLAAIVLYCGFGIWLLVRNKERGRSER